VIIQMTKPGKPFITKYRPIIGKIDCMSGRKFEARDSAIYGIIRPPGRYNLAGARWTIFEHLELTIQDS